MMSKKHRHHMKNLGDHNPSECHHTIRGKFIHQKGTTSKDGKETVLVRGNTNTREIIVPSREPLEIPGIMPISEYNRLKKQAKVLTPSEKQALIEETEKKKLQLLNESIERRNELKNIQLEQSAMKGSLLDEVESEASKKNKYLLQRAYELRQEQEDEVKGINGIILASKCLAIREAQIAEKKLIQKELDEEEKRLYMLMEQERQKGLKEDQEKRKKEEEKNQKFVEEIKHQVKENEIKQLIEAERKEEEARALKLAFIAMQQDDKEKQLQKQKKVLQTQAELKQNNEDMERYRFMQEEEERLADARLKEFMRKKAEREAALEEEAARIKLMKEQEIQRLRLLQEKAKDLQAIRDEQNAFRVQEEAEREWRRKEMEAAIKKKEMQDQLRKDRAKQIDDIRRAQALETARDEEEFHKVAKLQHELYMKEKEKQRAKREEAMKHRKEILKQVNEKERIRIEMRKSKMEEGHALRLEHEIRDMRVKETLEKKLEGLRKNNVPEQALVDIQRQINATLAKKKL